MANELNHGAFANFYAWGITTYNITTHTLSKEQIQALEMYATESGANNVGVAKELLEKIKRIKQ